MTGDMLILLSDPGFAGHLHRVFEEPAAKADIAVAKAATLADLENALDGAQSQARLLAFCTGVIVPDHLLRRLNAGAFNLHPGPPDYPGLFPSCFALYDGAESFGVTLHRMTDAIDAGEIIHTQSWSLNTSDNRASVDQASFDVCMAVLEKAAETLCDLTADLNGNGQAWCGRLRTRKDLDDLCRLPDTVTAEEFDRRYRAIGEGPDHALSITLFGHRFRLDNERNETVVRGGQTVG